MANFFDATFLNNLRQRSVRILTMKHLLTVLALTVMPFIYAQQEETTLFAQCVFQISDETELRTLESELREHPNVQIIRLDYHTQRAFVLTKDTEQLSEEEFRSWFGEYSTSVRCMQIGVYGVDEIDQYPFENCDQ